MIIFRKIFSTLAIALLCLTTAPAISAAKPSKAAKQPAKPTINASEVLKQANDAFLNYDFDLADELLEKLSSASDPVDEKEIEQLHRQIDLAKTMLDRVEQIVIVDSMIVDRDTFFKAYRLSEPTGTISDNSTLDPSLPSSGNPTVFVSESNQRMIWSAPQPDGSRRLVESYLLDDSQWEEPQSLGDNLNAMPDAAYPFLMADGSTLYFAARGEESLGGYDIFITRNNGDEYLQPQNIGMPYNSPYDDYLLAIDELTGAGWWATDRNQIPGKVTIYIFVPQELRVNYPADDPEIISHARLSSATIPSTDPKAQAIHKAIENVGTFTSAPREVDFQMALPGGRIITSFDQLSNSAAVEAMKNYLDLQFEITLATSALDDLRADFKNGANNREAILHAERDLDQMQQRLKRLANEVVRAESNN